MPYGMFSKNLIVVCVTLAVAFFVASIPRGAIRARPIAHLVLFGVLAFSLFVMVRNNWVFYQRMKHAHETPYPWPKLQSYQYMMWRFWIWDIEPFIIKEERSDPCPMSSNTPSP